MLDPRHKDYNPAGGTWLNNPFEDLSEDAREQYREDQYIRTIADALHLPIKYVFTESGRAAIVEIIQDSSLSSEEKEKAILAHFKASEGRTRYKKSPEGRLEQKKRRVQDAARKRKMEEYPSREEFFKKFKYCPTCEDYMGRAHHHEKLNY